MVKRFYINHAEAATRIPNLHKLRAEWESGWDERASHTTLEYMRGTFTEGDTMKFVSPERAAHWCLGEDSGGEAGWECKYEFIGRSGGNLALVEFMGYPINWHDEQVQDAIAEFPNRVLHRLCAMLEEIRWVVDHREEEYVYLMADFMRHNMPDYVPE